MNRFITDVFPTLTSPTKTILCLTIIIELPPSEISSVIFILINKMDTNLTSQLLYLVQNNTGAKLEKIIEQILESNLINFRDFLELENIKSV